MQKDDDNRDLLELLSRSARIPRAKLDEAMKEHSALDLIRCPALFSATAAEIRRINDIKEFTFLFERARAHEGLNYQVGGPRDAYNYLSPGMDELKYERFDLLMLDTRHRVIKRECISEGGLNYASVNCQKLLRTALLYNAAAVMLCHNHPSGDSKPSPDDINTTKSLCKAFELCSIEVVDHIVIGRNEFSSFKEKGIMEDKAVYRANNHQPEMEMEWER